MVEMLRGTDNCCYFLDRSEIQYDHQSLWLG